MSEQPNDARSKAAKRGRFRVRELAQERGLTKDDLARRSGLKFSTVQSIWQNKVGNPRYDTLKSIAEALGVSVDSLEWPPSEAAPEQAKEGLHAPDLISS